MSDNPRAQQPGDPVQWAEHRILVTPAFEPIAADLRTSGRDWLAMQSNPWQAAPGLTWYDYNSTRSVAANRFQFAELDAGLREYIQTYIFYLNRDNPIYSDLKMRVVLVEDGPNLDKLHLALDRVKGLDIDFISQLPPEVQASIERGKQAEQADPLNVNAPIQVTRLVFQQANPGAVG